MVLLALVDCRYRFMYINVGAPGRCNDSKIFEKSSLKRAFRFTKFLMKPYPYNATAENSEKVFNYQLSKSRREVENALGHLKARFRRIGKGIDNDIKNATSIIKCCCVLHNFVNERNDSINNNWIQVQTSFEIEHLRQQPEPPYNTQNHNPSAENIRESIASYLCTF
ncbi:PREDICTED: uncharacterized protein LOC108362694 [Rhagoletis zephyria]|uniref:uncharacterized protein LOC108362694 n=1 Tax=Rhagoletis zephyria TaxID=28612 RepID=UPI000811671F|nr:PREDICTED: uncharacterized protein LOC108362694 [Rhagoletis zephyria]